MMQMADELRVNNKTKISEQVSEILLNFIVDNNLKPGDKLPSEGNLSERLGVSSRSIREALKILQARGFVEILQGKGAFVIDRVYSNFFATLATSQKFTSDKDALIVNMIEVRKMIETSMFESAAKKRDDKDIENIEAVLTKLDAAAAAGDQDLYNSLDVVFHKTIVDCGKNEILSSFYNVLIDLIFESFRKTGYKAFERKDVQETHRKMFEAIVAGDSVKAVKLIEGQLKETEETLIGFYKP